MFLIWITQIYFYIKIIDSMKLSSIESLKNTLSVSSPFLLRRKYFLKFFAGDLVNYSYSNFSIGPSFFNFIDWDFFFSLSRNYISTSKGVVVSRKKSSLKILNKFNNYIYYKTFPIDSPHIVYVSLKKRTFQKKRSNISNYLISNILLKKKIKNYDI